MVEQPAYETMTEEELRAFARKMEEWGSTLSTKEQSFLAEILGRAASGDARGFSSADFLQRFRGMARGRGAYSTLKAQPITSGLFLPVLTEIAGQTSGE